MNPEEQRPKEALAGISDEKQRPCFALALRNGRDAILKERLFGETERFQNDPHRRDHILFYEYFHGDNGAGLGARHQTGWTGPVAKLIQLFGPLDPEKALDVGTKTAFLKGGEGRDG